VLKHRIEVMAYKRGEKDEVPFYRIPDPQAFMDHRQTSKESVEEAKLGRLRTSPNTLTKACTLTKGVPQTIEVDDELLDILQKDRRISVRVIANLESEINARKEAQEAAAKKAEEDKAAADAQAKNNADLKAKIDAELKTKAELQAKEKERDDRRGGGR
jgi:hypothetical protein